jgi:YjzC-like protein
MKKIFKPGQKVPVSAQYAEIGTSRHKTKEEVTSVKGKRFPPSPRAGMKYKLVDRTKHKR